MSEILADPGFRPFLITALILAGLVVVEMLSMLAGASASHSVDHMLGIDAHPVIPEHGLDGGHGLHHADPSDGDLHADRTGPVAEAFGWINVGRIPLLMLLMAGLAAFSVAGILIEAASRGLGVGVLSWLSIPAAVVVTVPAMRLVSRSIAWVIPKDQSFAIESEDLIGRTGEVTVGPVRAGVVARIKVQDRYGNWHFPRVVPFEPSAEISTGTQVLVVSRIGTELTVTPAEGALGSARH